MQVLNAARSSEYFDSLRDELEDSAVAVIHGAWLKHSSTLARAERLEPSSPLDMLILYRAAAVTFRDNAGAAGPRQELAQGGRVINRDQADQRLRSVKDAKLAALAGRFANCVIALSHDAAAEQDLNYYVELFLRAVQDQGVIDGIVSGSISRHAKQLADPDLW